MLLVQIEAGVPVINNKSCIFFTVMLIVGIVAHVNRHYSLHSKLRARSQTANSSSVLIFRLRTDNKWTDLHSFYYQMKAFQIT